MRLNAPIVGDRVRLDTFLPDQADSRYVAWLNDPEVTRFTEVSPGSYDADAARRYVAANLADDGAALLRIYAPEGEDGAMTAIGNLRLSGLTGRHRRAEIALIIGETRIHGKGYGTEAIAVTTQAAFERFGLHKVTAGIYGPNLASCRAFEKAGFACEAVLRDHALFEGAFVDILRYARFAPDAARP